MPASLAGALIFASEIALLVLSDKQQWLWLCNDFRQFDAQFAIGCNGAMPFIG